MRTWTATELRCFLEHAQDDRLFAAWQVLARPARAAARF